MTAKPKRMAAPERREQIVRIALTMIARYGVQGATNARIARGAGISEKMLYVHFGSRKHLLLAALDAVFDQAEHVLDANGHMNAIDLVREAGRKKWGMLAGDSDQFVYPLYEFLATAPESGFRDHVMMRQQAILDRFSYILGEGIAEGTVRPDVDTQQSAWELLAVFMSDDLWCLSGFDQARGVGRSAVMLERLLGDLSASPPGSSGCAT